MSNAMEPTLAEVEAAMISLEVLAAERLPVKAAWAVSRLGDACAAELAAMHARRDAIFAAAGCSMVEKKDPKKKDQPPTLVWHHKDGNVLKQCQAQVSELMTAKARINARQLDLADFGDVSLPGSAFSGLGWAFKDEGASNGNAGS